MDLATMELVGSRFADYVGGLADVIGHADREKPLNDYCAGLLVSEGRKSVEPLAAVTARLGTEGRACSAKVSMRCSKLEKSRVA